MFISQEHSYPSGNGQSALCNQSFWQLGKEYPGEIICTGPKYQYSYYTDGVHLVSKGYQQYGEKLAEIYYEKMVLGNNWQPLQPITATKSGKVITVDFNVPVGPLQWDTTLGAPNQNITEWKNGKGFEVLNSTGGKITISSVEITGNSVKITCASDITSGVKVAYAHSATGTKRSNGTSTWGLLKDSDTFKGTTTGLVQPNFCIDFQMLVQ